MNYLTLAHHNESTVTDIRCVHGAVLPIQYQYARRATAYLTGQMNRLVRLQIFNMQNIWSHIICIDLQTN